MKRALTDEQELELELDLLERLRLDHAISEVTNDALAIEYDTNPVTIWMVERGTYCGDRPGAVLTASQVAEIREKRKRYRQLRKEREPYKLENLTRKYGISVKPIYTTWWALLKRLSGQHRTAPRWEAS